MVGPVKSTRARVSASGVEVTLSTNRAQYKPTQKVLITIRVENNSASPVNYVCGMGFDCAANARIKSTSYSPTVHLRTDKDPESAPAMMIVATLKPGDFREAHAVWDQTFSVGEEFAAPTGTYTIQSVFPMGNDVNGPLDPVITELQIQVEESYTMNVTPKEALQTALAMPSVHGWFLANGGVLPCKMPDGTTIIATETDMVLATGDEFGDASRAGASWGTMLAEKGPVWRLTVYNKRGGSPGKLTVRIDPVTGVVVGKPVFEKL